MQAYKLPAIIALGLLWSSHAMADDTKSYLEAFAKRDAAACYIVVNADKRTLCIAEIKSEPAMCYSIFNPSIRDECRARTQLKK